MKLYKIDQNNSGGSFDWFHTVYVEHIDSSNEEMVNRQAEEDGYIYFNGCDDGRDCDCCGDRWYSFDEMKEPKTFNELFLSEETYGPKDYGRMFGPRGSSIAYVSLDGTVTGGFFYKGKPYTATGRSLRIVAEMFSILLTDLEKEDKTNGQT